MKRHWWTTAAFVVGAIGLLGLLVSSIPAMAQPAPAQQVEHEPPSPGSTAATIDVTAMHRGAAPETQSPPGTIGKNWPKPVEDSQRYGYLLVDQLEYQLNKGPDAMRWDVVGWYGGDYNRLWVKTEGDWRTSGQRAGDAQVQALYGRPIAPFWDVQIGVRYDESSGEGFDRSRGLVVVGFQGLAPYWFELEPALSVSQDGDVSVRFTASYDVLITQRLILQPRLDFDAAVQSVEKFGVGDGVNSTGLGLRLRYEIAREFAPYVGIQWLRRFGEAADIARRDGGRAEDIAVVFGVRLWF